VKHIIDDLVYTETFINKYHRISEILTKKKQLLETERVELLLGALPKSIQEHVFRQNPDLDSTDVTTYDYKNVLASAREAERIYERSRKFNEKRDPIVISTQEEHFSKVLASSKGIDGSPNIAPPQPPLRVPTEKKADVERSGGGPQPKSAFVTRDEMDSLAESLSRIEISLAAQQNAQENQLRFQNGGGYFRGRGGRGGYAGRGDPQQPTSRPYAGQL
jgi:hypothetical protein